MVNSRLGLFSAAPDSYGRQGPTPSRAPLLPKLRGQFAEFLNHSYLDRLSVLHSPTCVGFGTGTYMTRLEAFPGSMGSTTCPCGIRLDPQPSWGPDFPGPRPTAKPAVYQRCGWPTLLRPSIAQTPYSWCRNIYLLSIAYVFRPRLRSRLTLGRLALPRNP